MKPRRHRLVELKERVLKQLKAALAIGKRGFEIKVEVIGWKQPREIKRSRIGVLRRTR